MLASVFLKFSSEPENSWYLHGNEIFVVLQYLYIQPERPWYWWRCSPWWLGRVCQHQLSPGSSSWYSPRWCCVCRTRMRGQIPQCSLLHQIHSLRRPKHTKHFIYIRYSYAESKATTASCTCYCRWRLAL